MDMRDENPWGSTDLWWLDLSIYQGLLITNGKKKREYLRVGLTWFHHSNIAGDLPPEFSDDEYQKVVLLCFESAAFLEVVSEAA